jgi:ATP-dependent RNA helicase DHX37/DHR1
MFSHGTLSDAIAILRAVGAFEYSNGNVETFCQENFVRLKAMEEIHKLRAQLSRMFLSMDASVGVSMDPKLKPFNSQQVRVAFYR